MSKYLFIINDVGNNWEITGTRLERDDFVVDTNLYFETDAVDFYEFVKGLIVDNTVQYPKGVEPNDSGDLVISPMDPLDVYKARTRTRGKHLLRGYCDYTLQFDFFQFNVLNNKLINAGYVITDDNREQKYLDVVNAGVQEDIDTLDAYLEVLDRIKVHEHHYDNYQNFKTDVNAATSEAECDALYVTYSALI